MRLCTRVIAVGIVVAGGILSLTNANATEGGASLYAPGFGVPEAGVLPPPGVYFDSTTYFYGGKFGGNVQTPLGGNIVAGVKVNLWADFVTALWVTPTKILGGDLAFSATVPFGEPDIRAGLLVSGPLINRLIGRPLSFGIRDKDFSFGDPVFGTTLGWHEGNWHWKVSASASVPAGAYQPGELANVAFNRWIGDFSGAITYLDPALGIDFSASAGFELNGVNHATDYNSGNGVHFDVSAMKFLTKQLTVGMIAAHYQQVSDDSGTGARLGAYRGRTTAVGGMLGYTFEVGKIPVSTRVKLLREVDVDNRPEGTIGYVQVSFPLWIAPHATPAKALTTKF